MPALQVKSLEPRYRHIRSGAVPVIRTPENGHSSSCDAVVEHQSSRSRLDAEGNEGSWLPQHRTSGAWCGSSANRQDPLWQLPLNRTEEKKNSAAYVP